MRVSTAMFQQASLNAILDQQAALSKTQQQLATGKRILSPSDDPIGSSMLVDISQSIAIYEQFNRNADYAEMRLAQEESVLNSVTNALQRARELAVQANNDTYQASQRKDIAAEVRQILAEVMSLANTTDGNNNYLFSGTLSTTVPFSQQAPGTGQPSEFSYHGDQGQRKLQIGPQRTVADSDSGFEVFAKVRLKQAEIGPLRSVDFSVNNASLSVDERPVLLDQNYQTAAELASAIQQQLNTPDGRYTVTSERGFITIRNDAANAGSVIVANTDANANAAGIQDSDAFVSVFAALDRFAVALETNEMSGGRIADIDAALLHVVDFKSTIGARMNSIDRQRTVNEDFVFNMTSVRSEIEDLDFAEAISKMNLQLTGMQAAQQTFTKVQNLSLFNYI
ncbi:MAG: flagellar hook-associated protein FlgL [Chromatiales bacterium]|nr:flagellar hook-associated protein FlgL [Gammaproteobacteria bacterium]MBW6477629.1 flagellar hook-associated protein FlgL [Chromatiales bacterium]